jgi:hypothetical protein
MNIEYDHRKKWDTEKDLRWELAEANTHGFNDETINFQIYLFTKIANKKGA